MQEEYIQNSLLGISNDNLGPLFDHLEDGIIIIEQDGTISYVNESFVRQHNLKKNDLVGAFLVNLIPGNYKDKFRKIFKEFTYSDKDTDRIDYAYYFSEDTPKWLSLYLSVLRMNNDKSSGIKILGILREVENSKFKESQSPLLQSVLNLEPAELSILESSYYNFYSKYNFGVYIKHLSKKEIYVNDKLVKMFGFADMHVAKSKFNLFDYVLNDENYNTFLSDLNYNGGICSNLKINFHRDDTKIFSAILFIDFIRNQKGVPVYIQTIIMPFDDSGEKPAINAEKFKNQIKELISTNELILILNEIRTEQFFPYLFNKIIDKGTDLALFWISDRNSNKILDYSDSLGNNSFPAFFKGKFFRDTYLLSCENKLFFEFELDEQYIELNDESRDIYYKRIAIITISNDNNTRINLGFVYKKSNTVIPEFLEKYSLEFTSIFRLLLLKSYQSVEREVSHTKKKLSHVIRNELELLAVSEISQLLTEIIDYELILQKSLEKINDLFGFEYSWVYLINNNENKFTLSSCYNLPDSLANKLNKNPVISLKMRDLLKSREIVFSNNPDIIKSNFDLEPDKVCEIEDCKYIMLLPLKAKGVINGIMTFAANEDTLINEWDKKILDSMSIIIGSALENSLLYSDALNKTIELEKRNKELNDFTHIVSHDLKNPINNILGIAKIIKSEYYENLPAEMNEFIEIIYESSFRTQKLINDLLHFSRIGRVGEIIPDIDLNALVQNVLFDMSVAIKEKNVKVIFDSSLPIVDCDPVRIAELFQNLISNALKYNDKPEIIISLGSVEIRDHYEIYIMDNGIGISENQYKDIFQIFHRIGESSEEGSGIVFSIVKKIIEFHQG